MQNIFRVLSKSKNSPVATSDAHVQKIKTPERYNNQNKLWLRNFYYLSIITYFTVLWSRGCKKIYGKANLLCLSTCFERAPPAIVAGCLVAQRQIWCHCMNRGGNFECRQSFRKSEQYVSPDTKYVKQTKYRNNNNNKFIRKKHK